MPSGGQRLDGPGRDRVDANRLRSQIRRQIAHRRLERGLGHAHHIVVLEYTLATQVGQREDTAPAATLHQRRGAPRERDQRIRADIHRQPEALARRLDERRRQLFARGEGGAVHDEVQSAEFLVDRRKHVVDLRVDGDVAGQNQRIGQRRREIADVLLEPFALVRHGEPGARGRSGLRDGPGDRPLVGDAHDEAGLA